MPINVVAAANDLITAAEVATVTMEKKWFDFSGEIKRVYSRASWIPLRRFEKAKEGLWPETGHSESFEGAHSVAVFLDKKEAGEEYSWSDDHGQRPWADKEFYKSADAYWRNPGEQVGVHLVLRQPLPGESVSVWHLNPDLVIALELEREGDVWTRPCENYVDVARLRRDASGEPVAIEIRAEFLRDYLSARQCSLRLATYRERDAIVAELGDIDFPENGEDEEVGEVRLYRRAYPIDTEGSPFGAKTAVFKAFRTDVDPEEDVPVVGPETNGNTKSEQWEFSRDGPKRWRIVSEMRRDEWIEPAEFSPRVRGDQVPSEVYFIVEADGKSLNADELDNEDIGRWLWFSPDIVAGFLKRRGSTLKWYTRDTGGFSSPSRSPIHFGVNESGLITVYAYDVARLPESERRFWAGFNAVPEGKVSRELLSAQMEVKVAETQSPEDFLPTALDQASRAFSARFGTRLLRPHDKTESISNTIHRFRALEHDGLFSLAKDLARLTADSIDVSSLHKIVPLEKDERRGSLKSLERVLMTICPERLAIRVMGPLFSVYELRLADAHLPKSDLAAALDILDIRPEEQPINQGYKIIHATVSSIYAISLILRGDLPRRSAE